MNLYLDLIEELQLNINNYNNLKNTLYYLSKLK